MFVAAEIGWGDSSRACYNAPVTRSSIVLVSTKQGPRESGTRSALGGAVSSKQSGLPFLGRFRRASSFVEDSILQAAGKQVSVSQAALVDWGSGWTDAPNV